jgi:hypothetical protein
MTWLRRLLARLFRRRNPFALSQTIKVRVSPIELSVYQQDAERCSQTLEQWARDRLALGVSRSTLEQLSTTHDQNMLKAAFGALEEDSRVIPIGPRREDMAEPSKAGTTGHPCRHLDPTLPSNMTRAECQGVCAKRKPGWTGRPCYWAAAAAKQCDEFETKIVLPLANPGVR